MKRILKAVVLAFTLMSCNIAIAQDSLRTYMEIHLADGSTVKYMNTEVDHVSFEQIDMTDPAVLDSLQNISEGDYNEQILWENGLITGAVGNRASSTQRIRTKSYLPEKTDIILLKSNMRAYLFAYASDNTYIGTWKDGSFQKDPRPSVITTLFDLSDIKASNTDYKFKLIVFFANEQGIDPTAAANVKFFNKIYYQNVYMETLPPPTLTFIDDDGNGCAAWEELYNLCGVKPTMAVITSYVGMPTKTIDWTIISRLQNSGFEFLSHTHNHQNITTLSEESLISDLTTSQNLLNEHGCNGNLLVYPGNAYNSTTNNIVMQYYQGAFAQGERANTQPLNHNALYRYSILDSSRKDTVYDASGNAHSVYAFKTTEQLHNIIDEAVRNRSWVVFMCHFYNAYNVGYRYDVTARDTIVELVNYARSKGVRLMTAGQAFEVFNQGNE